MGLPTAGQQCHTWGRGLRYLIGWRNEGMHSVCVCACVYVCVYVCCVCVCMCVVRVCVCVRVCVHSCVCMCVVCVCVCVCACVCVHSCVCVCIHVCVCKCVVVCVVHKVLFSLKAILPSKHLFPPLSENTHNIIAPRTAAVLCDTLGTTSECRTLYSGKTESHVSTPDMTPPSFEHEMDTNYSKW